MTAKPTPQIKSSKEMWEHLTRLPQVAKVRRGDYQPDPWLTAPPGEQWGEWGIRAKPSKRGLTMMDINAAEGAAIPDRGAPHRGARGAVVDSTVRAMEWAVPYRYESWAENVASLYEEAVSRQWSAASAIPWHELEPLPFELERAFCQLLTFFAANEYLANDTLGSWVPKIPTSYHEVKMFLATQMMDEARHSEVFRKRVLANGGGMGINFSSVGSITTEAGLSAGWSGVSYGIHVFFEGVVLDLFRFAEFLGKTAVDKVIFQRVMQDEARHVSYGTMHLKYLVEHSPDLESDLIKLHAVADQAEAAFVTGFLVHPTVLQSLAVLAGDGAAHADKGYEVYRRLWHRIREEYLRRCDRAGFDRRPRCLMPADPPF